MGPEKAGDVGQCKLHDIQQGQVQGHATEEKDLRVLVDEKPNIFWQCLCAAQKAKLSQPELKEE